MIQKYTFSQLTASGSAGAAVGTVTSSRPLVGYVQAIHLNYGGTPTTTDVTIATEHSPTMTLLSVSNNVTDGWYYPRTALQNTAGGVVDYMPAPMPICDYVQATVAQADDDDTLDVTVLFEV